MKSWAFLLILVPVVAQAIPPWAQDQALHVEGNLLRTVCHGEGPALDLARRSALDCCASSALAYKDTGGTVRMLTVESERSVGYHQEIKREGRFSDLKCRQDQESIEERGAGYFTVWTKCICDLSTLSTHAGAAEPKNASRLKSKPPIDQRPAESRMEPKSKYIRSEVRTVRVATVPRCTSILVEGKRARVLECNANPVNVAIYPDDESLLVRANRYQPKVVNLQEGRKTDEQIQVILDPL